MISYRDLDQVNASNHISAEQKKDVLKLLEYLLLNDNEKLFYEKALGSDCNGKDIVIYGRIIIISLCMNQYQ